MGSSLDRRSLLLTMRIYTRPQVERESIQPMQRGDAAAAFLLVEDDPKIVQGIERVVRKRWPLQVANTVAAAREILEAELAVTAAIVDVMLPDGSGLDVGDLIRSRTK